MEKSKEIEELAKKYFNGGFNCAESTLLSVTDSLGINNELIPKVATGFGGGFGRNSQICGAISGAVLAIGIKFGRNDINDSKSKDLAYEKVRIFMKEFEDEFNSMICKELTGCDLRTREGIEKYNKENKHSLDCSKYVAFAAKKAFEMIKE
jgi:C_GCAxxG_C_C family probable redox protein